MRQVSIISKPEFKALIESMTPKYQLACYLMYYCGLRISEVVKLRWSDVDIEHGETMLIRKSKNLVTRTVILHREVQSILRRELKLNRPSLEDKIVPVRTTGRIYAVFKHWAIRLGHKEWHPHDLRHSCATNLIEAGMPISDVQLLLGHANMSTTARYLHPTISGIRSRYKERGWL